MKSSANPIPPSCLSLLAVAFFACLAHAQTGEAYRLHLPVVSPQMEDVSVKDFVLTTDESGNAQHAMVVGWQRRSDQQQLSAFVYDHFGFIDSAQPGKLWDVEELVGSMPPPWAPQTHVETIFYGINSSGRIVGVIRSIDGNDFIPFYLDLSDEVLELREIPIPAFTGPTQVQTYHSVNELGDILVRHVPIGSANSEAFIYNPVTNEQIEIPFQVDGGRELYFNSFREVLAKRGDGIVVRHTVGGGTEEFPAMSYPRGINENSQFIGNLRARGRTGKGKTSTWAARIGADGTVEWQFKDFETAQAFDRTTDLNDSGDVIYEYGNSRDGYYYHEGDPNVIGDEQHFDSIDALIVQDTDPTSNFRDNIHRYLEVSERDKTGFGWIVGTAWLQDKGHLFILIPDSGEPTPGITASPASGLVTTEIGGTDSFDVVLDTQPTDDVTIGISSSDTTEGTTDVTSLTFTPADWDIPQTVTVTGVNDPDIDGDIAYTIETATAASADPDYNGLDADDVRVTNLDDEQAPPITYNSLDPPQGIPDNNSGVATSTIDVPDSYLVFNQTVTLDISHQRPSDLQVFLTGPDPADDPIELFNYFGDNDVTGLFSETQGVWVLEVYDTRKKKTGTLNGWSITIDY